MTDSIRTGVVGVGHFGRYHAEKYAALEGSELIAVCDIDAARAREVAARHGVRAVSDHRELFGAVDAVSVAVPTRHHHEVASAFLEAGVHVLVEKPITHDLAAADDLIELAKDRDVVLQVGHLERFSSAELVLSGLVTQPLYIESYRIAPFQNRGTDVSVIFDLMIHDIDLIQALVKAPVISVDAIGAPVLTRAEDIANTRVRFANGCVANITASRISAKKERKMRIFQYDSYISADFVAQKVTVARKGDGELMPGIPNFHIERETYAEGDSLEREIGAFLDAVAGKAPPAVTGEDGRQALETAIKITDSLHDHIEFLRRHTGDAAVAQAAERVRVSDAE